MDGTKNKTTIQSLSHISRAGHARLACEVNPDVGDQQQEPTEAIQSSDNALLDAVGIPSL